MLGKEDKFVFISQGTFTKYPSRMTKDVFITTSQIWDVTCKDKAVETAHQLPKKPHKSPQRISEATHIASAKQSVKIQRQELTHGD